MPKKASTRKNPQQAAAEAEPAAAEAEPAAEEPEPAPALADVQFTGPTADVLVRILAAVESQKVGLEDLADQNKTLLGRVAALEVKEAAAPAVAEPEPEPAPALALALEPAAEPLPRDAQPDPVLQILLQRLDQLEKKLEKKSESEDPDDDLDYVPYHEGRGLNPFPVRPNGVTDKPQLYRLKGSNYEVYEYLYISVTFFKCIVGTDKLSAIAGIAKRAPDCLLTPVVDSPRACQVNSLGDRAQRCICWTSEAGAVPMRGSPFWAIRW